MQNSEVLYVYDCDWKYTKKLIMDLLHKVTPGGGVLMQGGTQVYN